MQLGVLLVKKYNQSKLVYRADNIRPYNAANRRGGYYPPAFFAKLNYIISARFV